MRPNGVARAGLRAFGLAAGLAALLLAAACSAGALSRFTDQRGAVQPPSRSGQTVAIAAAQAPSRSATAEVPTAAAPVATEAPAQSPTPTRTRRPTLTPTPPLNTPEIPACPLTPVVAPTSAPNPGRNRLDRTTGLHMTGQVRRLKLSSWNLKVTGKVANPLIVTYDELRCLPRVEETVDLGCPGYFLDTATWAGARLADVLALARPDAAATQLEMVSADNYVTELPLKDALVSENLIAYEWEGQPVPILHGFPVRAVIPNYDGSTWAKWLVELRVK